MELVLQKDLKYQEYGVYSVRDVCGYNKEINLCVLNNIPKKNN